MISRLKQCRVGGDSAEGSEMSETPKRYLQWCFQTHGHVMSENLDGDWVKYSDYERLQSSLIQCQQELSMSIDERPLENMVSSIDMLNGDFPFPWRAEEHYDKGWSVKDANGGEIMYCASFTGDGATLALNYDHALALVAILNSLAANATLTGERTE